MAGWADTYTALRSGMLKLAGQGGTSASGTSLPVTRMVDCVSILAGLQESIVDALKHLTSAGPHLYSLADLAPDVPPTMPWDAWLMLRPVGDDHRLTRSMPDPHPGLVAQVQATLGLVPTGIWYTVDSASAGAEPVAMVLAKRDAIYTIVAGLEKAGVTTLPPDQVRDFWRALYALLIAIEVGKETPTPGLGDRILGGIKYAAGETVVWVRDDAVPAIGEFAGQALATAGTAVGKGIGAAGKGFFEEAGLTAWMVVIAGIYLAMHY